VCRKEYGALLKDTHADKKNTHIIIGLINLNSTTHHYTEKSHRCFAFVVYGCRLSNLTLTRAHASMVPRTFEASMECDTGYALHPDRETETILENHCDISSSMWLQPGMTCFGQCLF